jgi:hypothetical protein
MREGNNLDGSVGAWDIKTCIRNGPRSRDRVSYVSGHYCGIALAEPSDGIRSLLVGLSRLHSE